MGDMLVVMNRRTFLSTGLLLPWARSVIAASPDDLKSAVDAAARGLQAAAERGPVHAAALHVRRKDQSWTKSFGKAGRDDAMFLLGSITKPICMTALMTLYDQKAFQLDDRVRKFLPAFTDDGRDEVTIRHLMTHVSGLPDQLPDNAALRAKQAPLAAFVEGALRVPLGFAPGSKYEYSSMGILLASRIAEIISQTEMRTLIERAVYRPLGMTRSVLGVGERPLTDFVPCQTEFAAPEAGAGDPSARNWDWNSPYWRGLGAPWGGGHSSAEDIGKFLGEFLLQRGAAVRPETARLMITNQNPPGFTPRGLGLVVGTGAGSPGCSERTFGHTGSTGTIAWADPATETICVVLTSLPARAVKPHPRDVAAAEIARSRG